MSAAAKIFNEGEFIRFISKMIEKITGVQLGSKQEVMVKSRVIKRALELQLNTTEAYAEYFFANQDAERKELVSLLTTHHTFFFREFQQFEILQKNLLDKIIPEVRKRTDKKIKIWSAACSRGQEVYSLAMFMHVVLKQQAPDISFEIYGSDIDEQSIKVATNGVYHAAEIKEAPLLYVGNHWAKGTKEISDYVKAKKSLKDHCKFGVLNLMDSADKFPKEKYDFIFCRNVFIYFTQEQIQEIVSKFYKNLEPHGYLFSGISESLNGYKIPLDSVKNSIYRMPQPNQGVKSKTAPQVSEKKAEVLQIPQGPLRVFCIDDSPTIHSILKQILGKDGGFEIIGTALNGKDAAEKLKNLTPDVITLDIHMPEMNGIEYLKKHFNKNHPPVVMISSVSREDSDLAFQALKNGASDYVEKPALANMQERGEEICLKLRAAFDARKMGIMANLKVDKEFAKKTTIKDPAKSAVVVIGSFSHTNTFKSFLNEWGKEGPPVYFMVEGSASGLDAFVKNLSEGQNHKIKVWQPNEEPLKPGEFALCDFKSCFTSLKDKKFKLAINAHKGISKKAAEMVLTAEDASLFIEESKEKHPLQDAASDSAPSTSFPYFSWKALSER